MKRQKIYLSIYKQSLLIIKFMNNPIDPFHHMYLYIKEIYIIYRKWFDFFLHSGKRAVRQDELTESDDKRRWD